jgi:hypothetical protein
MTVPAVDTTWGPSIVGISKPDPFVHSPQPESTKTELAYFLTAELETWRPDLVIVVERRGTAILRALKEATPSGLVWPWDKVISSRVLDQRPSEFYQNKRILIFDDMKRRGTHVAQVLGALRKMDPSGDTLASTRVSVFAMHEEASSPRTDSEEVSQGWYYRGLTTEAYRNKRLEILTMLQQSGSLMLDTEHIEVRARLRVPIRTFLLTVTRRAHVVSFRSLGGRNNLTVFFDDTDPAHQLPAELLPAGCSTTGIVKKCRIIERSGNEFAIIPICYPAVPVSPLHWPTGAADTELLGEGVKVSGFAQFYGVALISALSVLGWVLKSIYASDESVATIYLPQASINEGAEGYSLEHLRVMYPTLSLPALADRISQVDADAARTGTAIKTRPAFHADAEQPDASTMQLDAWHLLQLIRYRLDGIMSEARIGNPTWAPSPEFGLTATEIFDLGQRLKFECWYTSSLFDLLIDAGHLVTQVGCRELMDGDSQSPDMAWTRTFQPDGEMVSELVRMYTIQRGLPSGF